MIDSNRLEQLWTCFREMGQNALNLSHYELSDKNPRTYPEEWKQFLMLPEVSDWVNSELGILQNAELNKLLHNVSNSNSVGRAQLINSLTKMQDASGNRDGPVFIYTYVPLDSQQQHATNVRVLERDVFLT